MFTKRLAPSSRQLLRLAIVVTLGVSAVVAAKAGEVSYSSQQRMACMSDAFRFCAGEIPDVAKVRICMIANKPNLSDGCRATFRN